MSRSLLSHLLTVAFLLVAASLLYGVKYKVQDVKREVRAAQTALLEERKGMQVAAAEWAYLSRPDRVGKLSEKYLTAHTPVAAKQVTEVAALAMPNTGTQFAAADLPERGAFATASYVPSAAPAVAAPQGEEE